MNDKYISLIAKYMSGDISDDEREDFFEQVNSSEEHRVYFDEMQNLWEYSGEEEDDTIVNTEAAWQKVTQRIEPTIGRSNGQGPAKVFRLRNFLKIAVALVGIVGAIWLLNNWNPPAPIMAFYETQMEETKELTLPDGSVVLLNEGSTLSFDKKFEPRVVQLTGEAFFEVKHLDKEHQFEIQSGDTKTTVLGTSFNVRAYPEEDQVEVTVETGRVIFENEKIEKAERKVELTAGESGVYQKKEVKVIKPKKTISNANAWRTRELNFKDTKIKDVIAVLERYFDVKVSVENPAILNCPFTGDYPEPKIEDLIGPLQFTLDIDINQNENNLTFSGKGCD